MADISAEQLAQRAYDAGLLDAHQLESIWGELGSREVDSPEFISLAVRRELLTNFQIDRLIENKRDGYFYGKYKLLYMVGTGTFARVYRAVNTENGRVVAVKVLRQRYSDDMVSTEQFLREARMVMELKHPNIVLIHDVDTERHRPYMVMDFVEGQNLRDFVRVRGHLEVSESLRLTSDVCAALDYALNHGGITHRDLKMSNVLVSSHGRARLVDFGLAAIQAVADDESIKNAPNPRSIDYAGLERITGVRRNDPRSDIYFVGCMLYHMLSGKSPLFETRDRARRLSVQRYREVKPIGQLVPGLPAYVMSLVHKAMDLKAERRFQTPGEMLKEVKSVVRRLEGGDTGEAEAADTDGTTTPQSPTETTNLGSEGESRTIMIVESRIELQNLLRERLKRRGYRVLVISDPQRAMARFDDDEIVTDCVIFSAVDLADEALEAFNRFGKGEETSKIPAILLVDQKQRELVERAELAPHRITMSMPIQVKKLRAALLKLINTEPSKSPSA